jgi:Tfp pilus assembly protein PilV
MVEIMRHIAKRKLPASTILEVVTSMVIIVIVMGIALMILSNVMRLSLSLKQMKANALLQQELIKSTNAANIEDETIRINEWRIEKTFKPYTGNGLLMEADFTIYDPNNLRTAELKSLVVYEKK